MHDHENQLRLVDTPRQAYKPLSPTFVRIGRAGIAACRAILADRVTPRRTA